jgi:hypothetical protein
VILIPHPHQDKYFREISKETSESNDTINQIDLKNTYRIFQLTVTEYTISAVHTSFSEVGILEHKASLNK